MSTIDATYFLCRLGTTVRLRIFHVSPFAGMRPVPMTKSRISDSRPLLKELACVSSISFATSLSDTTTNFFGPMARTNISPYARKSLYRGTNTGWPAISRMSPAATGMRLMDSFLHLRESLARDTESPRAWGLSTFLINPRMPLSRSSAGDERGLVNSPDAMRSSRVLARHGVAARRRGSVTPAARPDPRNDSDPKPRIARPAPRLEREDADGATRARPSVGALPVASDDCITTGSGRARLSSKSPGA
mmetsp:Transcript_1627/g.6777  ORF Transcript_1627/g.6777 Transcript_1627/m.6777 type:complete len:248 (-) Transcript_1627:6-749(-)